MYFFENYLEVSTSVMCSMQLTCIVINFLKPSIKNPIELKKDKIDIKIILLQILNIDSPLNLVLIKKCLTQINFEFTACDKITLTIKN